MSLARIAVTWQGPASSTVTRSSLPSSRNRWVMPSFLARMAGISTEGESDLDVHAGGQVVQALERVHRLGRGLMNVDQALVRPDLEVLLGVLVLEGGLHHGVHVLLRRERHRARHCRAGPRRRLDDLLGRCLDGRRVVRLETDADLVLGYGHFLSGACVEVLSGFLRAMRASPGLSGPALKMVVSVDFAPAAALPGRRGKNYLMISVTTPEPTVRPPSRMAKRSPASMAMG